MKNGHTSQNWLIEDIHVLVAGVLLSFDSPLLNSIHIACEFKFIETIEIV